MKTVYNNVSKSAITTDSTSPESNRNMLNLVTKTNNNEFTSTDGYENHHLEIDEILFLKCNKTLVKTYNKIKI